MGEVPARILRGAALLILCSQRAGTTMTNACGIQESYRAIALGAPLLEIERMEGLATEASIWLRRTCGARKPMRKR